MTIQNVMNEGVDFETPDPTRVLGLSTSHFTGVVNWKVAFENGVRFCYIKAQDGTYSPVRYFKENYEGAKKAGVLVGGYTWLYHTISPGSQAHKFAQMMKDYPCDLPGCVDYEWTGSGDPNIGDLKGFTIPYVDTFGSECAIYTSSGYWDQYGSKSLYWKQFPLWQAQYNHGNFDVMQPWNGNTFLQWTEVGRGVDYGVPLNGEIACELNYYSGTIEQLYEAYGNGKTPPLGATPSIKADFEGKIITYHKEQI